MKRYPSKNIMIIVICILLTGLFVYKQFIRIQNIFDQMYYTRIRTHYDWWEGTMGGLGNKGTSFGKMPQIEPISRDSESVYTADGYFINDYKDSFLQEGERISIYFDRERKILMIAAQKQFSDFKLFYEYTYDVETKQINEAIHCTYVPLDSGESNNNKKEFSEYTKDLKEILAIIEPAGLTENDLIQYKKYFLYDKLLTDWLNVNHSRFSVNQWGRVEYIEVLPLESSE